MSPIVLFQDWLSQYVTLAGYTLSRGMWDESAGDGKRYVCLWIQSGRAAMVGEVTYPHIRIIVAGERNGRSTGDTPAVEAFAQQILEQALLNSETSCIAHLMPLGNLMGPSFSDQGRPYYELNFELTI